MFQKSTHIALAFVLSLSLFPAAAYATGETVESSDSPSMAAQVGDAPLIVSVSVRQGSRDVIVTGQNFGSTQATSSAQVFTGGISGGAPLSTSVASWSDTQVNLTIDEGATGIIDVVIATESGSSHKLQFVSLGPDVYEEDLPKPADIFENSYSGPVASADILQGWGEYLYYLRQTPVSAGSSDFAFSAFERYGIETGEWETLESLPEQLAYASGCVWEGNFLVAGVVYDVSAGGPVAEERIYLYNFELANWAVLDSQDIPLGAGIVNLNGFLTLVGGADDSWAFTDGVYEYDTGSGIGEQIGSLEVPAFCPQLAVNEGNIFVYSYGDSLDEFNGVGAERHLQVVADEVSTELVGVFPDFAVSDVPAGMPGRAEGFGSIAAAIEGLMLVGPAAADGATDTYILDWDYEGSTLLPYYKRASDAQLFGAAACIHDNMLYAAGASMVEPAHAVFRATEMIAPSVEKGNYSVWRQGSEETITIVFTPDYSRFYDGDGEQAGVYVDGVEIYGDTEYNAAPGSTEISLFPSYLSTLALGEHEMTVYFDGYEDGPGAEVPAYFTIEPAGNNASPAPIVETNSGRARPAALAMTGDVLLVVPFAVLGIGALAVGIYLVRRRIRNR